MKQAQYFFKFTETQVDGGTVWYTIQVLDNKQQRQPIKFRSRYSQMRQIHDKCANTKFGNDLPEFPHKKLFGNTKPDFIEKRKKELEHYYNTLVKTIQITKLPQLKHFIFSHQKKTDKKIQNEEKQKKNTPQLNIDTTLSKEKQLKKVFDGIVKKTIEGMIDISDDCFKQVPQDSSKQYKNDLQSIKPPPSQIVNEIKVQGHENNDGDFWSMFFGDENAEILQKSKLIAQKVEKMNLEKFKESKNLVQVL